MNILSIAIIVTKAHYGETAEKTEKTEKLNSVD